MLRPVWAHLSFLVASERNTRHQTPSSREVPNLKHQTSKSDAGANGAQAGFKLGAWCFMVLAAWELRAFGWALSFSKVEIPRCLGCLHQNSRQRRRFGVSKRS